VKKQEMIKKNLKERSLRKKCIEKSKNPEKIK
jgi:hypothetical protein